MPRDVQGFEGEKGSSAHYNVPARKRKNTKTLFWGRSIIRGFSLFAGGLGTQPHRKARDECTQYRQIDYTVRGFLEAQKLKVFYFSLVANISSVGRKILRFMQRK